MKNFARSSESRHLGQDKSRGIYKVKRLRAERKQSTERGDGRPEKRRRKALVVVYGSGLSESTAFSGAAAAFDFVHDA
ncbi:hypothetical protein GWI33_010200 [Rhynchophorus ferrugineus]|uniref:Uncharacterized protein n=1 Tax=Rhynchophorus ferrugineus TaxID=354439 RepID=A0A834MME0_RHYFE|nr:hypothetical protein GWI33_010200 [Rhynchophorus ferrugineus]